MTTLATLSEQVLAENTAGTECRALGCDQAPVVDTEYGFKGLCGDHISDRLYGREFNGTGGSLGS